MLTAKKGIDQGAKKIREWTLQQIKAGPKTANELRANWKAEFNDDSIRQSHFNPVLYQELKGIVAPTADKPPKFKLL